MGRMSTILIIDDDPRFRTQARDLLEADGFVVIGQAVDGASGLEAARSLRPDFVLLDIGLPDVEGFEVARSLAIDGPPPLRGADLEPRCARVRAAPDERSRAGLHPQGADLRGRDPGAGRPAVTLRLVLADDSMLVREGVARLLVDAGFEVVAQVGDADALLRATREHLPDVAIVDIRMPPTHTDEGLRAAEAIRAEHGTAVGILVLSQHVEPSFAHAPGERRRGRRRLPAQGQGHGPRRLRRRDPADREGRLGDRPRGRRGARRPTRARVPLDDLTEREREVLALMAEGRSNQAIGDRLAMARKTVEAHIANIFSKLELQPASDDHRRVLAVLAHLRG